MGPALPQDPMELPTWCRVLVSLAALGLDSESPRLPPGPSLHASAHVPLPFLQYVPKDLLPVYKEKVVPVADIITPNQFEAE